MEKYLSRTEMIAKFLCLALLLMGVVIVVANAASVQPPLPTSYWGYVRITENGSLMTNTSITVLDAAGNGIVSATSKSDGSYLVIVPWDDTATTQDEGVVSGETITFTVSGKTVTSRVIDAQGTNNRFDLAVPTSTTTTTTTTTTSGSSASDGWSGTGKPAITVTKTPVITVTETPAITVTGTPAITATETPAKATTTIAATPPVKTPGIPPWITMVVIIVAAMYLIAGRKKEAKRK